MGACGSGRGSIARSGSPGRHVIASEQRRTHREKNERKIHFARETPPTSAEGKVIRTDGSGSEVLALRDGSRVEMSEGVELSINRATDGIQVD